MPDPTTLLGVARIIKKPLDDLYDLGKTKYKTKLQRWKADKNINQLYKRASSVQKVKTIWQVDKEVNLNKFYYPSKIIIDNKPKVIKRISQLPLDTNIILQGTVGQGKSILLRYLSSQELTGGVKIPIFIELRRITKNDNFLSLILKALNSWDFNADVELLDFFPGVVNLSF